MWAVVHGWQPDVGRGILWWHAFWSFVGLSLIANAVLESGRFGASFLQRLVVWLVALVPLVVITLSSAPYVPLAVMLVWVGVAVAVASREGFGRSASNLRSLAPS